MKGETHTATLVLETHWNDYNLHKLVPWLIGDKAGSGREGPQQQTRLKLHYVAMSRPTHLLCLALKKDSFHDASGNLDESLIAKAKHQGWDVSIIA